MRNYWTYLKKSLDLVVNMGEDKVFFGAIVAMFAFMTGNPVIGLIVFFLALLSS